MEFIILLLPFGHTNDTLEVYKSFGYEDYRDRMS